MLHSKNRVVLLSKDENRREPWEGERRRNREREREQTIQGFRFFMVAMQRYKPKFPLSSFSFLWIFPLPENPFHVFFLFHCYIDWLLRKIYGLARMDDFRLYPLNDLAKIPKNFESLGCKPKSFLHSIWAASNSVFNDTDASTAPFLAYPLVKLVDIESFLVDLCWIFVLYSRLGCSF